MLATFFVLAYVSIAVMSMRMTLREYQATRSGDIPGLVMGALACLFWPIAAFFLLLMLNLTTSPAPGWKQTT